MAYSRVEFDSVTELEEAIKDLARMMPDAGFEVPEDGLKEGRDYEIIE